MAIGVGVDIEDVSRFEGKDFDKNKAFYDKIFTEDEISYCLSRGNPAQHFAARFCAKEATIKALGRNDVGLKQIEIINEESVPKIKAREIPNLSAQVSLSHTKTNAIAIVIVNE